MHKYNYSNEVSYTDSEAPYPLNIPRRYDVPLDLTSFVDEFEWQVTYKFSSATRNNAVGEGKYGADAMTFRRLYVILCEAFNDGNYFIEDYLVNQYPYRMKDEADKFLKVVNQEIMSEYMDIMSNARLTKNGKLDKRYTKTFKSLAQYSVMADERVKEAGNLLAEMVKEDIRKCLSTGILMLSKTALAEETVKKRVHLGLPPDTIFFATGQLIDHVQIYFRLGKTEWLNQYL